MQPLYPLQPMRRQTNHHNKHTSNKTNKTHTNSPRKYITPHHTFGCTFVSFILFVRFSLAAFGFAFSLVLSLFSVSVSISLVHVVLISAFLFFVDFIRSSLYSPSVCCSLELHVESSNPHTIALSSHLISSHHLIISSSSLSLSHHTTLCSSSPLVRVPSLLVASNLLKFCLVVGLFSAPRSFVVLSLFSSVFRFCFSPFLARFSGDGLETPFHSWKQEKQNN